MPATSLITSCWPWLSSSSWIDNSSRKHDTREFWAIPFTYIGSQKLFQRRKKMGRGRLTTNSCTCTNKSFRNRDINRDHSALLLLKALGRNVETSGTKIGWDRKDFKNGIASANIDMGVKLSERQSATSSPTPTIMRESFCLTFVPYVMASIRPPMALDIYWSDNDKI